MPLRLTISRKLTSRSDRVKCVDLHPTEPWLAVSLYSGHVHIWNHESSTLVKTLEVCELPVRAVRFAARKNWFITGSDDMTIRVYNYNTLERVTAFEAHSDYVRSLAVHPQHSFVLSSSDDMTIKLWNWDKQWACQQVFEGHTHYVMQIAINPKDNNTFASASLDRTIKVWQLGSNVPNFTLEGHEKGVNCVDYYHGGDKPYLISGADDRYVKIWDYQNKSCVQTLEGHAQNIAAVAFHPELPIIITGSEDGTVRIWHANTYRLENTLNYGLERVWAVAYKKGSNAVALGYDEGSIIVQLGREEPAMSMDNGGKIVWAKHSEIQQANLKALSQEVKDGERLTLSIKDMGACDIFPQTVKHNPNGRFVVVCGDGEYIIYTAMALRNKAFGSGLEFVWAADSSQYAVRESSTTVKVFKNFKEKTTLKPEYGAEGIFGGALLGVKSPSGLAFYDWDTMALVRRIEIEAKMVFWSESNELVTITTDDGYFVLSYDAKAYAENAGTENDDEDGVEAAFDVVGEVQDSVRTGVWVGDCFIYTNDVNRLNYYVGGEIVTISHLDRVMYILGYIAADNRLYLADKELNVVSFSLLLSVLEYQTAVMRNDFGLADKVLPTIPKEQRNRVALFLEKQGYKAQALAVSSDKDHQFDLAVQIGKMDMAYQLAKELQSEAKWKQLADLATEQGKLDVAQECLHQAQDFGALLLLATSSGNKTMVEKLGKSAEDNGQNNVAFLSKFISGDLNGCLELLLSTKRVPEAALFAKTYLPSKVDEVVEQWRQHVGNEKIAMSLAKPADYGNLFPNFESALTAETLITKERQTERAASCYGGLVPNEQRNVLDEINGEVASYDHVSQANDRNVRKIGDDDDDEEEDVEDHKDHETKDDGSSNKKGNVELELDKELEDLQLDDIDSSQVDIDDDDLLDD